VSKLREIIDILKGAKHSNPKPVFCPVCKSPQLKPSESYGILPQKYVCGDCGYEGNLVLELDEEESEP
jgi:transposase-like protein